MNLKTNNKSIKSASERSNIFKNELISEETSLKQNKDNNNKKRKSIFDDIYDDGEKYNNKEYEDEEIKVETSFKQKLDSILNNDKFNNTITLISFIFSVYVFFVYIVSTYFPLNPFEWFSISNIAIATFYNLETIINLYLSQHKLIYLLSFQNILELFTSIYPYFYKIKNYYSLKVLEISRVCHLFRISKYFEQFKYIENNVTRGLIHVSISFLITIFFFAAIFRIIEIDELYNLIMAPDNRIYALSCQIKFHEFLYYTVITLFTLGYGEIYPISELGRIIIIFLIFYGIYLIQDISKTIFNTLKGTSIYSRVTYKSYKEIPHIVVCGTISVEAITSFCDELFHPDHGQAQKNLVILNKNIPSNDMKMFLHTSKYEINVKYIQGNPLNEIDLEKAGITKAKVIIILTDKYSLNMQIDYDNIYLAIQIRKYLFIKDTDDIPIYLQLINPNNIQHYFNYANEYQTQKKVSQDRIIVNQEVKINLISKSCLIPGLIPFISNLIRSSSSSTKTKFTWLNEYLDGVEQEIYRTSLNEKFKDKTFSQISKIIYENFDAIAFAFEIEIYGKAYIFLNPGDFFIHKFSEKRDDIKYYIYVICSDKEVNNRIMRADFNDEDESDGEDNEFMKLLNEEKEDIKDIKVNMAKNMTLKLEDMLTLEDNSLFNYNIHNEEDDYFFINSKSWIPPDFKKDSIRNNSKYKDHIIICGTHRELYKYILPLRAKYLGPENLKYIVILTQNMPKNLWDSISRFEKIILINGSPLNKDDLYRANVEFASKAIILEDKKMVKKNSSNYSFKTVDNNQIFIYTAIKKCNPNIQVMIELAFESNMEYLLDNDELVSLKSDMNYNNTRVFCSGEIYINSIIDSLTAQAYYNKHIVTIIHQLLVGERNTKNSKMLKICENIGLKSSNFWQTGIPEKFVGKKFGELFNEFCDKNLIILALYRLPGSTDNYSGYVFTKPNSDIIINHKDRVFILGEKEKLEEYFKEEMEKREENISNLNKDKIGENIENNEEENDDEDNNKYSPFYYFKDRINEVEKEIVRMSNTVNNVKSTINEVIASGIKQEIISTLQ